MQHGQTRAGPSQRLGDLDETPRVRARERIGARREHVSCLAVTELACGDRLRDVVDPRRAAAQILLRRLDDGQTRDALEQRPPRGGEPLRVTEVTRVLVGDRQLERLQVGELHARERLGDVERREAAILQMRPASGGVDDDGVELRRAPRRAVRTAAPTRRADPRARRVRRNSPARERRPRSPRRRGRARSMR